MSNSNQTLTDTSSESQQQQPANSDNVPDTRKLVPPPPIIGPDGKEIPRPRDESGRPLPIYINADGKPVLDNNGKPIPLRFGADRKPIPLESSGSSGSGTEIRTNQIQTQRSSAKVSKFLVWIGGLDGIMSLCLFLYYAYLTSHAFADGERRHAEKSPLATTTVLSFLGSLASLLPIFAVKTNKFILFWTWCGLALILFFGQVAICSGLAHFVKNHVFLSTVYSAARLSVVLAITCFTSCDDCSSGTNEVQTRRYITSSGVGHSTYPRGSSTHGPQTIIVQQPTVVPSYGYGYGYGYPGYYGGGVGNAALLGLAAGSMLGGPYYYDSWGWGGGYWDDGFYY